MDDHFINKFGQETCSEPQGYPLLLAGSGVLSLWLLSWALLTDFACLFLNGLSLCSQKWDLRAGRV